LQIRWNRVSPPIPSLAFTPDGLVCVLVDTNTSPLSVGACMARTAVSFRNGSAERTRMPLAELTLPPDPGPSSDTTKAYIRAAACRAERVVEAGRVLAFVPSDYAAADRVLRALAGSSLVRGPTFCEWGSGLGAVTGLAGLAGFDAYGIEAAGELVDQARRLADEFRLSAVFAHGSFVPRGGDELARACGACAWLAAGAADGYAELGLAPADLDVVYAYPWPDEEAAVLALFEAYAGPGAVLVTFHGGDYFRVRRKVRRRGRRG